MTSPSSLRLRNATALGSWLFGLMPIIYLLLAAWVLLDLPFPRLWGINWDDQFSIGSKEYFWPGIPTFFTLDSYDNDLIYPLDGSFRNLMASCVFIGLISGAAFGLIRTKFGRLLPYIATSLVLLASGAFLVWELGSDIVGCSFSACYEPSDFLRTLGAHNLAHGSRSFLTAIEAIGIIAIFTCMSIWSGVGAAKILSSVRAPIGSRQQQ
jgi:hypothetical protein